MRMPTACLIVLFVFTGSPSSADQLPEPQEARPEEQRAGLAVPASDRLRVSVSFLAGYGNDAGNADKGFEKQGRIGSAIITIAGRLTPKVSYLLSMNPVNEISPLPACREPEYFRPNDPQTLYADLYAQGRGPQIDCDPQGSRRVDLYRFIALDMLPQQGALREAWVRFDLSETAFMQVGRMAQSLGFTPEEAGSWTAKDAPLIQRLNRDAFFTLRVGGEVQAGGVRVGGSASAIAGDSDASKDYGYNRLFADGSLDGNSGLGAVGEAYVRSNRFDVRVGYRLNQMGSKIESLAPSYWAAGKHDDSAFVLSGQVRISEHSRVLAECAAYTVGLKESSALMVGSNPEPVRKKGCYVTLEGGVPIRGDVVVGGSFTREEIDRADSMIRYLAERGLYGVVEGRSDRMSVIRFFIDLNEQVRLGAYLNDVSNPFPWVSGIWPVEGPNAFAGRSLDRWGLVMRFVLQ